MQSVHRLAYQTHSHAQSRLLIGYLSTSFGSVTLWQPSLALVECKLSLKKLAKQLAVQTEGGRRMLYFAFQNTTSYLGSLRRRSFGVSEEVGNSIVFLACFGFEKGYKIEARKVPQKYNQLKRHQAIMLGAIYSPRKGSLMSSAKPNVGAQIEQMRFPCVGGSKSVTIGQQKERWTMVFVYRGKHCPRCKRFLNKLNAALASWEAVLDVIVVSADTEEKAKTDKAEFGWDFDLCYGMSETQMRALGLYVSAPLSEAETTGLFAEPGAFGIRPDGTLMLVDISNGPAARPDLEELLDGMKFNIDNNRPERGTA